MERLKPFFPKSHGNPRVDDRRVPSGMIFVNRNGLRWCDAPREYGPAKSPYNRWKRWSDNGGFARIMTALAAESAESKTIMIDATDLEAYRAASSLGAKKGDAGGRSGAPRWHEHQVACCHQRQGSPGPVLHVRAEGCSPVKGK